MKYRFIKKQRSLQLETLEPRLLLAADPVITEFLASNNDGLLDDYGNSSDWIEIYNAGDAPIDLEGWHLTDDFGTLDKWTFPDAAESELDSGEYLVVFASSVDTLGPAGNLHTNFSLSSGGEYIGLVRPDLTVASEFGPGGIDYPQQRTDISYGVQGSEPPSSVGITYIDADEEPGGNTSGLYNGWVPRGAGAGDGSSNFGNLGGTLQANGSVGQIVTTATGLDVNQTYDVYAFFWDATSGSEWNLQAGLSSGGLLDYDPSSSDVFVVDSTTQFPGSSQLVSGLNVLGQDSDTYDDWVDGNRILYGALLGQVGGSASASVYIDHNASLSGRAFYDGIGIRPTGSLVGRESAAEYLIPTNGSLGTSWTSNSFDAAANGFVTGQASIGYENNPSSNINSFADEILTTVPSGTTSVYVRTEFDLDDASAVTGLTLNMKYDDGFVAYLNGTPVLSQFAPPSPAWNSTALQTGRPDSESLEYQEFSLGAFVNELVDGQNTLAIHALNRPSSTDFLMSPLLTLSTGTLEFDEALYHITPTPGFINGVGVEGFVGDTTFSVTRGFYDSPFTVEITTPTTPTADIYYTLDGTEPSPSNPNAVLVNDSITVSQTTSLRAAAFKEGFEPTVVDTQTYVFLEDVVVQDPLNVNGNGTSPSNGLTYPTTLQQGFTPQFDLDPEIVTAANYDDSNGPSTDIGIRESLLALPTVSLTLPHNEFFGPLGSSVVGIATDATQRVEHSGSIEYFDPNTGQTFQFNAEIEAHGNSSRNNSSTPKHSFRVTFNRTGGGPGTLSIPIFENSDNDDINVVVMRGIFTEAFAARNRGNITNRFNPLYSTYIRDTFLRDTQIETGNLAPASTYAHLYINGLYWGLYNPTERIDDKFLESNLGGNPEDYDIVRGFNGELFRGQRTAYNELLSTVSSIDSLISTNLTQANLLYQQLQGNFADGTDDPNRDALLDVDSLIDYLIIQQWSGAGDWPGGNWYAARNRVEPGEGFQFLIWDQELSLDQLFRDRTGNISGNDTPGELYNNLRDLPEFQLRYADRAHTLLANNGPLSPVASQARWDKWANFVEPGIVAESARWGDAQEGITGDVAFSQSGPAGTTPQIPIGQRATVVDPLTIQDWRSNVEYVRNEVLGKSADILLGRLLNRQLFTTVDPPVFQVDSTDQHGGVVTAGSSLSINSTGTVYYTTNGTDPRDVGGAIAGTQFTMPISLDTTTVVKARTFSAGQWSALSEATFTVTDDLLVISEINYNPYAPTTPAELAIAGIDNDDFEFIEILNTSATSAVNLNGIQLTDAVEFTFGNIVLDPGERALVVEDTDAFTARYGAGLNVVGQWSGGLSNGGEQIAILSGVGTELFSIEYNDNDPWAISADGSGATLVLDDPANTPADQRDKYYRWRGSVEFGGAPGAANLAKGDVDRIVINEVLAHTDLPALDTIELYNPTDADVDISGWSLSDSGSNLQKFTIPAGTVLLAGNYITYDESDFSIGANAFSLDSAGDEVYLTRPDGLGGVLFVDQVDFGGSFNGESFGRVPNGSGRLAPLVSQTFEAANSGPRIDEVVLSEVNYHPENPTVAAQAAFQAIAGSAETLIDNDLEFIEVHNSGTSTVNLTNWRLRGESDLDFAAGTMLAAGESLLAVTFDPTTDAARLAGFLEHYGLVAENVTLVGGLSNNLNNGFGRIELQQPDVGVPIVHVLADEVLYDDLAPWPTGAGGPDGGGQSLHRRGPTLYGNAAESWTALLPSPGSVGFTDLPSAADFNGDLVVNGADFLAWQRGYGLVAPSGSKSDGDADNDQDVDGADLAVWLTHFGSATTVAVGAATVAPEPISTSNPIVNLTTPNAKALATIITLTPGTKPSKARTEIETDQAFEQADGANSFLGNNDAYVATTFPPQELPEEHNETIERLFAEDEIEVSKLDAVDWNTL